MAVLSDPGLGAPASSILLVLGQTPFPIELLDDRYRVVYGNAAYFQWFLEPAVAVLDQESPVFPQGFPGEKSRSEVFQEALEVGVWKGETRVTGAQGKVHDVRLTVFPIHATADSPRQFAVLYQDIKDEVATRTSLEQQQNLSAVRSRQAQSGELLNIIAHQWRQPLTVIMSQIGNLQLKAQMGEVEPAYLAGKLEKMSRSIQYLSETIDLFRNFYGPGRCQSKEDLAALVHRALELLGPSLQSLGVTVEFHPPASPLVAKVYPGEFLQVVLELITNARTAMASLTIGDKVLKLALVREGDEAVFRVFNNGVSLPSEVAARLTDPATPLLVGNEGLGLGLHMVKVIVESRHGGSLRALSADGWTEFCCALPLEGLP